MSSDLTKKVKALLDQQLSKEQIYLHFLQEGKSVEDIEQAYRQASQALGEDSQYDRVSAYAIYFGFILISLSAIFYVAANWQHFSPAERVLILVSSFVICQIIGYSLLLGGKLLILGQGFILLGVGLYGASVVLLGQIFNVPVKWSQGTFIWLGGVLAILLVVDFFLLRVIFFAGVLASLFSDCGLFLIPPHVYLVSFTDIVYFTEI